jgi:hypothetical protein
MMRWLLMFALVGCRGNAVTVTRDAAPSQCAKVGDSCEYAPGKLGVCIDVQMAAGGTPKLVCQSQH